MNHNNNSVLESSRNCISRVEYFEKANLRSDTAIKCEGNGLTFRLNSQEEELPKVELD